MMIAVNDTEAIYGIEIYKDRVLKEERYMVIAVTLPDFVVCEILGSNRIPS